jgi:hypothetical protein
VDSFPLTVSTAILLSNWGLKTFPDPSIDRRLASEQELDFDHSRRNERARERVASDHKLLAVESAFTNDELRNLMTTRSSVTWRPALTAALAIWLLAAFAALAQTAPITDQYRAGFEVFDRELKEIIRAEDVTALTFLVDFPLQVVHADRSVTSLGNAQALSSRFSEVFTPAVRRAILDTRPGGHCFTSSRIAYLNEVVWVGQLPGEDGVAYSASRASICRPARW